MDKPGEYERMVTGGELEQNLSERLPPIVVKVIRGFAWLALSIGVGTVVWIIWALLLSW